MPDPGRPLLAELSLSAIAEANVVNVNVVATDAALNFLCLHCFSTSLEIEHAEDREHLRARANTLLDIRRGMFIQELHPLLSGEQLALWVFLCQYKA